MSLRRPGWPPLLAAPRWPPLPLAQAQTKIKMVLNWKYQGPQAWFFMAQDKGYFKAEGPGRGDRPGRRLVGLHHQGRQPAPTRPASATSTR
jgi:hypothetical protein